MKKVNLITAAMCFALAGYTFYEASTFQHTIVGTDHTGPAFFPRVMAAVLALLALVLVVQTLLPGKAEVTVADPENPPFSPMPLAGIVVLAVYILLLEPLGFIIDTILLALAFLLLCGVRKWYVLLVYPLVSSILVYYVFRKLLMVYLPEGLFYF